MAINFLDNVQFNQNQLLGARLQLETADTNVSSPVSGQIIYNSTSNKFKYYNGTDWIDPALGGISGSGTVGTIPIFTTNTTTIGNSGLTVSASTLNIAYPNTLVKTLRVQEDLEDVNNQTGTAGQLLSSLGGGGSGVDWIDAPVSYTKWLLGPLNNTVDINDGDRVRLRESSVLPGVTAIEPATKSGTAITQDIGIFAKNMTNASPSAYSTDVLLWSPDTSATTWKINKTHIDDIPVSAWGDATDTINMGGNKITNMADPTQSSGAATKAYVDSAVEGGLNVKGGFRADTGAIASGGNLTVGPSRVAIAVGDYYVVTVAGNFFGNAATPLTPGDSVLVQAAAAAGASVEDDFAVIQSDTDLATATTVGIGNVNASTTINEEGLSLSYANGTATVGFNIKNNLTSATALADGDVFAMFQGSAGAQGNFSITSQLMADYFRSKSSFAGTSSSGTTHTFNHNLNSFDVMVQIYNNAISTQDTVYAETVRTSANQVVVTTASSANIRCLIQKIG